MVSFILTITNANIQHPTSNMKCTSVSFLTVLGLICSCLFTNTSAFSLSNNKHSSTAAPKNVVAETAATAATAALSFLLLTADPAHATSPLAAQIQLQQIPPTSVEVNIRDLPLIGDVLSGTYTKVSEPIKNPSIKISSPKDKIGAIKSAATNGHLEFDVGGKLASHLDIDISASQPGVAQVRVASPLIPQLPFKNPTAYAYSLSGKEESDWFVVTNMGNGESYYYNQKTGDTTFQKPRNI